MLQSVFVPVSAACIAVGIIGVGDAPTLRTIHDYAPPNASGMNIDIPKQPLTPVRLERWASTLEASDEQVRFMQLMYAEFVKHHNEFMDREAPQYWKFSADFAATIRGEGFDSPNVRDMLRKSDQLNLRMRRELISLEQALIDEIAPALTDEQAERLDILRDESTRRNCRTCFVTTGRWANVELRENWHQSVADEASPTESDHVKSLLADYEHRLTILVARQADVEVESRRQISDLARGMNSRQMPGAAGMDRYYEIMAHRAELAKRVRLLHEECVRNISLSLRPELAQRFVDSAKRTAFPEIYPDPFSLEQLASAIHAQPALDPQVQSAADALFTDWRQKRDEIEKHLERKCIEFAENYESGAKGYEPRRLPEALKDLLEARQASAEQCVQKLAAALPADVMARCKDAIPPNLSAIAAMDNGATLPSSLAPKP